MTARRRRSGREGRAGPLGPICSAPGHARFALVLLALSLVALGCASDANRYRYRAPVPVAEGDWQVCHARADREAQRRYDRYMEILELAGPFGGPFGGVTLGQRAWKEREAVYESELVDCLTEKGYAVRTRPGEPEKPWSR